MTIKQRMPKRTVPERDFALPRPGQMRARVFEDGTSYGVLVLAVGEAHIVALAEGTKSTFREHPYWEPTALRSEVVLRCTTAKVGKEIHDRFRAMVPWWHYWPMTLSVEMALREWIDIEQHQQGQVNP